jgi:hypothetical protein
MFENMLFYVFLGDLGYASFKFNIGVFVNGSCGGGTNCTVIGLLGTACVHCYGVLANEAYYISGDSGVVVTSLLLLDEMYIKLS